MILLELEILILASLSDIKTMEVPIWLSVVSLLCRFIYLIIFPARLTECFISCLVIFALMFMFSLFGTLGGADCLIGSTIGMYLGFIGFYAIMFAFALSMPQVIYKQVKGDKSPYPFIPYLFTGYLIIIIYKIMRSPAVFWSL